jgi:hypothetical protein
MLRRIPNLDRCSPRLEAHGSDQWSAGPEVCSAFYYPDARRGYLDEEDSKSTAGDLSHDLSPEYAMARPERW